MAGSPDPLQPPHCPSAHCGSHRIPGTWRFKRKGFYRRRGSPQRIQRYLCSHCRRSFSEQTFSTTYWLKRSDLLRPLFFRLLACSALRQIAQEFDVAHTTVAHQAARLGRHCLLLHERLRPQVEQILGSRLFCWQYALRGWLARCYFGRIPTRCIPRCRPHALRYAL